ncbi:MAG: adenosylcobinamide amidohydrolase [Pseudomonadota bacterium]
MKLHLSRPWLIASFDRPLRALSWSLNRPGFVLATRVVWREVRNADLPVDLDASGWFNNTLIAAGYRDAIGLITSRDVQRYVTAQSVCDHVTAEVVATVGLSNAERVGHRRAVIPATTGTINTLVSVSTALSEAALIEAMSVAAQARTTAVLENGPDLPGIGRATGTGTDCIVVAAPSGDEPHAGLHTATGQAIGAAVLDAMNRGVQGWMQEQESGHAGSH